MGEVEKLSVPMMTFIVIGVSILYAVVGVLVGRRYVHRDHAEGHNETIVGIFVSAASLYAVLSAFLVVDVWEKYDNASAIVQQEASTLATMYRMTNGMPQAEQTQMRGVLRTYTNAVIDKEWTLQVNGKAAPEARRAIGDLYRYQANLAPALAGLPVNAAFVQEIGVLADDRNKRTLASEEQLPMPLWIGLLVGQAAIIGFTFLCYMKNALSHVIGAAGFSAFIGMLLLVTMIMDHPFSGALAIDSAGFEHSLSVFDSVDKGN
jgi:hypothetical protein